MGDRIELLDAEEFEEGPLKIISANGQVHVRTECQVPRNSTNNVPAEMHSGSQTVVEVQYAETK